MKKLLVYPVLLLLLFNSMGYYVIFELNRHQIRKEMHAGFRSSSPVTVIEFKDGADVSVIRWVHKNEFIYKETLYDVVYVSKRAGKTIYYCLHDQKEERLVKEFQKANSGKTTQAMWNLMVHVAIPAPVFRLSEPTAVSHDYPLAVAEPCSVSIPQDYPPPRSRASFSFCPSF